MSVKRVLERILEKISIEMHSMKLRLMPQIRYNMDASQKKRLRNGIVRHKWVIANLIKYKALDFNDNNISIRALDRRTIRKLIMDLEGREGDKVFIAIEYLWQGE